jgi:diphthamide biosynthesis protein 3
MSEDDDIAIYDEIEIEDMTYDEALGVYHYPCPCGDKFQIALDDLRDEQDIAVCPSCSLMIRVIFDLVSAVISCCVVLTLCTDPGFQDDLPKPPPSGESGSQVPIAA